MKHTLRKEILEKRDKLDSETIKEKSKKVKDKLFEKKIFDDIYKIGLYFAKENEVLTKEIIISLIEKGKRVFLPRIKGKKLEFREIKKLDELER
ncbi:5-formyltetrahydrofolate cyclo-ligase, partial [Candidatus Woesearchaeota archaeon]|nr:5-formyltetrahydrofolate cyclo-ligase [Candidatus Woesearchaeota archaeon]